VTVSLPFYTRLFFCRICSRVTTSFALEQRFRVDTIISFIVINWGTTDAHVSFARVGIQNHSVKPLQCQCEIEITVISEEIHSFKSSFTIKCMKTYIEFEIQEAAYDISCPDAECAKQGVISLSEIETLVSKELVEKHNKFRLNR
ncbi:hypothetical protein L9F63_015545, partial [Diploptera punctata]